MNILLFSLPGTPIVYYGDEIGMGDNYHLGDRNGVRTPMQWNVDRNAGFSRANPQKLYLPLIIDPEYHYEAVNAEDQEKNQASLLWWMRRVIAMRKRFKAFGRGTIEFLFPDNPKVLAFIRQYQDEVILAVINLSRFSQAVKLDLSKFSGFQPEDIFSGNKFPPIKDTPYLLTLGHYDYFWFVLKKEEKTAPFRKIRHIPHIDGNWKTIFTGKTKELMEREILPPYMKLCRYFGGNTQEIQEIKIAEHIKIKENACDVQLLFLEIKYTTGSSGTCLLPLSLSSGDKAESIVIENPHAVVAHFRYDHAEGIIYDSLHDEAFRKHLLGIFIRRHTFHGLQGELITTAGKMIKKRKGDELFSLKSHVMKGEQNNSSILYGKELICKIYRRLDEGINPELEICRFLTDKTSFRHVPPLLGAIEYRRHGGESVTIGMLQAFIQNEGDAWTYTLDWIGRYLGRILARKNEIQGIPPVPPSFVDPASQGIPLLFQELIGGIYLEMVSLLGKRTAELHLALASETEDTNFVPEPFTTSYQSYCINPCSHLQKGFLCSSEKT